MNSVEDMKKIIYTAQGRSTRASSNSAKLGIYGLYTSEFSTCCILAIISNDSQRISLIHADPQVTITSIIDEIDYVQNNPRITFIFRQEFKTPFTEFLEGKLRDVCGKQNIPFNSQQMDENRDGILLSLEGLIQTFQIGQNPPELEIVRHPEEQNFSAVSKIEQLIGIREKLASAERRPRRFNIFDGLSWEPMYQYDKEICKNHPATKEEMNFFKATDCFLTIAGKLGGIAQQSNIEIHGDQKTFLLEVGFSLEGYLNKFDINLLFIRNMARLVDPRNQQNILSVKKPTSKEDKIVLEVLKKTLLSQKPEISRVNEIISQYSNNAPDTPFKAHLISEHQTFSRHLENRNIYLTTEKARSDYLSKAKALYGKAQIEYKEARYEAAANLFFNATCLFSLSTLKDDPNLANSYFSLGLSLKKLNKTEEARTNFEISKNLYSNYIPESYANKESRLRSINRHLAELHANDAILRNSASASI